MHTGRTVHVILLDKGLEEELCPCGFILSPSCPAVFWGPFGTSG